MLLLIVSCIKSGILNKFKFKNTVDKRLDIDINKLGVTDLVMLVCQLLRRDLQELQELVDTIEPVKSWDKG